MRSPEELHDSAQAVLERAYVMGAYTMAVLFSGGHDSLCAAHEASQHRSFNGKVHHIDTTICSRYTRLFVEGVCRSFGWQLVIHRSNISYESIVREHGFPGPGAHHIAYTSLKERCVDQIVNGRRAWRNMAMLVNGARREESVRRFGRVEPVFVGEIMKSGPSKGKRVKCRRCWTAPCHDWTKAEQVAYMEENGLPINKVKIAVGLSGECFCGAFASPGEIDTVREWVPDVAMEIDRLAAIARECGKPCVWGKAPAGEVATVETGPLCSSCDRRAAAAGLIA